VSDKPATEITFTLRDDPRAAASIRRTRARVAAAAFAIAFIAGFSGGAAAWDTVARALLAGIVGWYVGWAAAVTVWRHLLVAEVRAEIARRRVPQVRKDAPPS
jgi:uncharacterized membrane protein YccC